MTDNSELIAEAHGWTKALTLHPATGFFISRLADALEAAEQRASAAEREMHARELHHFEAEEGLAAALAVIAEAKAVYDRDDDEATDAVMYEILAQSPADALEAVKAAAVDDGIRLVYRDQGHPLADYKALNPYRAESIAPIPLDSTTGETR